MQPEKRSAPIYSTTQAELDDVLNTQPLDEDAARSLICKLAQEQYDAIGNAKNMKPNACGGCLQRSNVRQSSMRSCCRVPSLPCW